MSRTGLDGRFRPTPDDSTVPRLGHSFSQLGNCGQAEPVSCVSEELMQDGSRVAYWSSSVLTIDEARSRGILSVHSFVGLASAAPTRGVAA